MKLALALSSVALVAGCASSSPTPLYDAHFFDAVRESRRLMVLNPSPAPPDVQGLDGRAAQEAIGRYHDTFKSPPPVVNVINIGGEMGSSSPGH